MKTAVASINLGRAFVVLTDASAHLICVFELRNVRG